MRTIAPLPLLFVLLYVSKVCAFCVSPNATNECKCFANYTKEPSTYFKSNTAFYFFPGVHVVEILTTVDQVKNISFIGNSRQPEGSANQGTIIECHGSSGFIFNGTVDLTFANLTLIGCAMQQQDNSASLYLVNVSNVRIDGVLIQGGKNGILMSLTRGYNSIERSAFINVSKTAIFTINSEVSVSTSYFASCNVSIHSVLRNITITNCTFVKNNVGMLMVDKTAFSHQNSYISGSVLEVGLYSEFSEVYVQGCSFVELNTALKLNHNTRSAISSSIFKGPGMAYGIDEQNGMDTSIEYCNFSTINLSAIQTIESNNLFIHGCNFTTIYTGVYARNGLNCTISQCVFAVNEQTKIFGTGVVTSGMANVYVHSSKFISMYWGTAFFDTTNSTIANSIFITNENAGYFQLGDVSITDCLFTNYSNSALIVISTYVYLSGNTSFLSGRSRDDGGALYLSSAVVTLVAPANISFINNTALLKGGAIYAINYLSQADRLTDLSDARSLNVPCFLQFYDPSGTLERPGIKIYFANNYAQESGSTIYGFSSECSLATSFLPKYDVGSPINILKNLSNLATFDSKEFASDPSAVCIMDNEQTRCPPFASTVYNFTLYPGQSKTVLFTTVDEYNGWTPTVVYVHSLNYAVIDVFRSQKQKFKYDLTSQRGNTTLYFVTESVARNYFVAESITSITLQVLPCPFGFTLDNATNSCICDPFLQNQPGISCNITDTKIYKPLQAWVGNVSIGLLAYYGFCSYELCNETTGVLLSWQDDQCRNNRTGVLCGSCKGNLSEVFGELQCLNCSNWYLFLILPFAIMGVALVALLLVLNLTVSNGMIDGFIFYANVIKINSSYFLPITVSDIFTSFLSTLIAWLNLDLGIVTCFYDGMSTYVKVWLQFVFPVYLLSLVGGIVLVGKYSTTVSKLCRYSVVPMLSTLVLLCYTKLLGNVIAIFSFANLAIADAYQPVWQYDGNVKYFDKQHTLLVVVAIVVLVIFIVPYILLMLFSPCLRKVSHRKCFSWINTLKPFLDCYEAPFLPKHRFWTGVLLIARLVISTTKAVNFSGKDSFNMGITIVTILCLLVYLTKCNVYKSWVICSIEIFLYINLILLSLFRILFQNTFYSNERSKSAHQVTYSLGVGSAVIVFSAIIIYRVYDLIKKLCTAAPAKSTGNVSVQFESGKDAINYALMQDLNHVPDSDKKYVAYGETSTSYNSSQYREEILSM